MYTRRAVVLLQDICFNYCFKYSVILKRSDNFSRIYFIDWMWKSWARKFIFALEKVESGFILDRTLVLSYEVNLYIIWI